MVRPAPDSRCALHWNKALVTVHSFCNTACFSLRFKAARRSAPVMHPRTTTFQFLSRLVSSPPSRPHATVRMTESQIQPPPLSPSPGTIGSVAADGRANMMHNNRAAVSHPSAAEAPRRRLATATPAAAQSSPPRMPLGHLPQTTRRAPTSTTPACCCRSPIRPSRSCPPRPPPPRRRPTPRPARRTRTTTSGIIRAQAAEAGG